MSETIKPDKPLLEQYEGRCLTVGFVAKIFSASSTTVRRWCERGLIEAFALPKKAEGQRTHWRIRGRAVDALIQKGELPESELE